MRGLILITLVFSILSVFAMHFLKLGSLKLNGFDWSSDMLMRSVVLNPNLILGMALYLISFVVLLVSIRMFSLSQLYPLSVGMNILLMMLIGWSVHGETISALRLIGAVALLCGIYLVARY